jgi:hypothetical protein
VTAHSPVVGKGAEIFVVKGTVIIIIISIIIIIIIIIIFTLPAQAGLWAA